MSDETKEKTGGVSSLDGLVGFSTRNSYIVCGLNIVFLLVCGNEIFATAAIIFGWLPVVFGNKPNVTDHLRETEKTNND